MTESKPHLVGLNGSLTEAGMKVFTRTAQIILDAMVRTEDNEELPEDENFLNDIFDLCEEQDPSSNVPEGTLLN